MKNIFTFKKFTKFVLEKYPLLQLECNKWNYTNILKKNVPNNRLIKKDKNQTTALQIWKERPVQSQLALPSSPD